MTVSKSDPDVLWPSDIEVVGLTVPDFAEQIDLIVPATEAVALNARLKQDAFAGLADCYTLDLFLRRMGLTEDQTS